MAKVGRPKKERNTEAALEQQRQKYLDLADVIRGELATQVKEVMREVRENQNLTLKERLAVATQLSKIGSEVMRGAESTAKQQTTAPKDEGEMTVEELMRL